jgi:DNA end-binding protein Ku
MARAVWKGRIKLAELTFPVSLYAAAATSQRVSFHILNRKTRNRVHREYVDEETGKPVEKDDQVKGYEIESGEYVVLQPEEIAAAVPEGDKTIRILSFIECDEVNSVYFDRPYFLTPNDKTFGETFAVLRDGMAKKHVAALGQAVLFRRVRNLIVRTHGAGLIAHTLNFDYEVRPAREVFHDLPEMKIEGELLELAQHIIDTKSGAFDPREFDDRYDQALAELVRAKQEGREIKRKAPPKPAKVTSLLDALRESAKATGKARAAGKGRASGKASRSPTRKAG